MPSNININKVDELTENFKQTSSIYFTKYTGMSVLQATEFRAECNKHSVRYIVSKNTLTKIAANNAGYGDKFDDMLNGQVGIAYGYDDPTSPAKAIKNFLNENKDAIEVLGIYFDGELYGPEKYSELASLPSKDELLSKLASGLNYPMTQLSSTLNGAMTKLAWILDSLKNIK